MSLWWWVPLGLGAAGAAVAWAAAVRLRREHDGLRTASGALRDLTVTVRAARRPPGLP